MPKVKGIDYESVVENNPQIDRKLLEEYRILRESLSKNSERPPMGTTYRLRGPLEDRFSGFHRLGVDSGVRRSIRHK